MKINEMNAATEKIKLDKNRNAMEWMLSMITACPQIVQKEIGAEAFAEELIKSSAKYNKYSPPISAAIREFLPFITACPQVFQPGIGVEACLEELGKAAIPLAEYTQIER